MNDQFFSWDALTAMGGSSLLTFYIVQYTKTIMQKYTKIPTDFYAVFVSFIVLLLSQLALGANGYDWRTYILTFANSFLVAAASAQIQVKSVNPPNKKSEGVETKK